MDGVQAGLGAATVGFGAAYIRGERRPLALIRTAALGFARGFTSGFIAGALSSVMVPKPLARTIGGTVSGFIFGDPVGGAVSGLASGLSRLPNAFQASTVGKIVSEAFAPTELGEATVSPLSESFKETMDLIRNRPFDVDFGPFGKPDTVKTKK